MRGCPSLPSASEHFNQGVVRDFSHTAHEGSISQRWQRRQRADGHTVVEQSQRCVHRRAVPAEGLARAVLLRRCCRAGMGRIHCLWREFFQTQTVWATPPSAQGVHRCPVA